MKALLQRVEQAALFLVEGAEQREHARIGAGLCVLVGVASGDTDQQAVRLAEKTVGLRIFADAGGKLNLDAHAANAELLVVSQFTLLADSGKGRRPSFGRAAHPSLGQQLFDCYVEALRSLGFTPRTGVFGAHMLVQIHNDGPVTIMLDTDEL